jgi:hypothetical protein
LSFSVKSQLKTSSSFATIHFWVDESGLREISSRTSFSSKFGSVITFVLVSNQQSLVGFAIVQANVLLELEIFWQINSEEESDGISGH